MGETEQRSSPLNPDHLLSRPELGTILGVGSLGLRNTGIRFDQPIHLSDVVSIAFDAIHRGRLATPLSGVVENALNFCDVVSPDQVGALDAHFLQFLGDRDTQINRVLSTIKQNSL